MRSKSKECRIGLRYTRRDHEGGHYRRGRGGHERRKPGQTTEAEIRGRRVRAGGYISYAACGIPYFVGRSVGSLDDLIEVLPDEAREKRGIDLRLGHTAVAIDPSGHTITVENNGRTTIEPYDCLVIATGARSQTQGIDMSSYPGAFTMNDLYDARKIADYISERRPRTAAVIGGGYIGLEAVESFCSLGMKTILIHRREDLNRSFEKEMSDIIKRKLSDKGVDLSLGKPFSGLENRGGKVGIVLGEDILEADVVLLALGVEPNSEMASEAGIGLGTNRAIRVNEYMETDAADV